MEPITAAIVAALTAGALSGLAEGGKTAVTDAYQTFKEMLAKKFGARSQVVLAIERLETKPESAIRQEGLAEEIVAVGAEQDSEVLVAAKHLLMLAQPQQAGLGNFTVQNNAKVEGQTIGDHNTITQQFGDLPNV